MKVFIVGAGAVASVLAKELAKENKISRIVCSSRHIENARKFIKESKKVGLVEVDATQLNDLVEKTRGFDLLINASLPHFNKFVLQTALKVGANYIDLDSENEDKYMPKQFKFDSQFKKKRIKGLVNAGISPGITNLFVKEAYGELDSMETVRLYGLEDQRAKRFIFSWSPHVNMDELKSNPLVYINGKFSYVKPLAGEKEYVFPGKLGGKRKVYDIYGDEVATIPRYLKVKNVSYKVGGADIEYARKADSGTEERVPNPEEMMKLLKEHVIEDGIFISSVECIGKKNSKNLKIRYDMIYPTARQVLKISPGATYISYATGIAAAIFAKNINSIKENGIFSAEAIEKGVRKKIISDLKKKGIKINRKISYI